MNYHGPRELIGPDGKGIGKWHYTSRNDRDLPGAAYPEGNCSAWEVCPECKGRTAYFTEGPPCPNEKCSKGMVKLENPCPGHNTPEEACEHQRQYELDKATFYKQSSLTELPDALHKCKVCGVHTAGCATWGNGHYVYLCDEHCDRAHLDKFVQVGESFGSY